MSTHDIEQERQKFEAFMREKNPSHDLEHEFGIYRFSPVQRHWDTWQAAIEADRKRRGEPVATVRHFHYEGIARNGPSQEAVMIDGAPMLPEGTQLYAAPQPAETTFTTPDCPRCGCVQDGQCLCNPSRPSTETVKESGDILTRLKALDDVAEKKYRETASPYYEGQADAYDMAVQIVESEGTQPAEPVKMPSEAKEALWKAYESLRELEKRIVLDANQISGAAAASFAANRVLALLARYATPASN